MYQKTSRFIFLLVWALALLAAPAAAHLDAGQDVTVGQYLVDFGYAPAEPAVNQSVVVAFNLGDAATETPVVFTDALVRLRADDSMLFAATLAQQQPGNVTF